MRRPKSKETNYRCDSYQIALVLAYTRLARQIVANLAGPECGRLRPSLKVLLAEVRRAESMVCLAGQFRCFVWVLFMVIFQTKLTCLGRLQLDPDEARVARLRVHGVQDAPLGSGPMHLLVHGPEPFFFRVHDSLLMLLLLDVLAILLHFIHVVYLLLLLA